MNPLGLRIQIVVALAFLVALSTALTGFTIAGLSRAAVYDSQTDAGTAAAHALAETLGAAAATRRTPRELENIAVRALGRAGIDEIVLYGLDRRRVLHVHLPGRGGALRDYDPRGLRPRSEIHGGSIHIFVPSDSGAAVAVNVSLADATRRLASLDGLILGYAGISALILLVFGVYAMNRLMVRPLERVREAAERVATGSLDVRVPVEGGRELVELARSFNRMTENLRIQRDQLEAQVREIDAGARAHGETQGHLVRSEKLASVGRLAAGLAHEVGNPISAILGFCDLLEAGSTPEEARDYVARMKREAQRVNRIVRDLLSYARPGARQSRLELGHEKEVAATDVSHVVEEVAGLLWPQKGFRDVEMERVVAADLPRVAIAGEELSQVLVNLLMNAADAMQEKGQVRIEVDTVDDWRATPDRAPSSAVRFRITDSGPGIPSDQLGRIFDPFFTTKEPGRGTGLGLAICQSIVEGAGGRIEAGNAQAGGAEFTIHLPAALSPESAPAAPPPA